jgi:5-methylcytosine-specific restriction endonuclease McrBC regulatory subunit McrC
VVIGETDILDGDNPVTRLLAWAAEFLAGSVRLLRVRARIVEARTALGYVPAQRPSPLAAMRLRLSRAAAHYGDALAIARAVALSKPQTEGGGATPSYGVLFNTERAFELLVSSLLFRASIRIGTDVRTRPQRLETLAFALTDTVSPLAVRPDDQLVRGGSTLAAIDAKYKTHRGRGPSRPSEDDFRQALASAIATHSHTAFLVYPVAGDKAPDMLAWQVRLNAEETVTVHSIGLPLMSLADASGVESLTAVIVNAIQDSGALA